MIYKILDLWDHIRFTYFIKTGTARLAWTKRKKLQDQFKLIHDQ
jgi:hypothetical protein